MALVDTLATDVKAIQTAISTAQGAADTAAEGAMTDLLGYTLDLDSISSYSLGTTQWDTTYTVLDDALTTDAVADLSTITYTEPVKPTFPSDVVAPTEVNLTPLMYTMAEMETPQYSSTNLTALVTLLTAQLEGDMTGLSSEVQTAIFDATRARDLQAMNDKLDALSSIYARQGFPVPAQMLSYKQTEVANDYTNQQTTTNYKITELMTERAWQNQKFAEEMLFKVEALLAETNISLGNLFVNVANIYLTKYKAMLEASLGIFREKIQGLATIYRTEADVKSQIVNTQFNMEKLKVDVNGEYDRLVLEKNRQANDAHLKKAEINSAEAIAEANKQYQLWSLYVEDKNRVVQHRVNALSKMVEYWAAKTTAIQNSQTAVMSIGGTTK